MSTEQQPKLEQSSSKALLSELEKYLNHFEIGSPEIMAFNDFSRLMFFGGMVIKANEDRESSFDARTHIVGYASNRIAIIEERIEGNKAAIKGYHKRNQRAFDYFKRLRFILAREKDAENVFEHYDDDETAIYFSEVMRRRLDRG